MQPHYHAIVWIDHQQAKVFHVGLSGADQIDLHPRLQTRHIHHKANSIGSGHVHEDKELMQGVADAVSDAGEILIIGPAGAKTELAKYLRANTSLRSANGLLAWKQRTIPATAKSLPTRKNTSRSAPCEPRRLPHTRVLVTACGTRL
jgi:stalled ribosome rescue protein Dom34